MGAERWGQKDALDVTERAAEIKMNQADWRHCAMSAVRWPWLRSVGLLLRNCRNLSSSARLRLVRLTISHGSWRSVPHIFPHGARESPVARGQRFGFIEALLTGAELAKIPDDLRAVWIGGQVLSQAVRGLVEATG